MKKKKLFFGLTVPIIVAASLVWGNVSIETSEYTVNIKDLPKSFEGFRIVHISDLHNTDFGGKLVKKITEAKPDIIVITGDIADFYSTKIPVAAEFARNVCKIAPVYYVTGNHEGRIEKYGELKALLEDAGVEILENKTAEINRNGEKISITGVDDMTFCGSDDKNEQYAVFSQKLRSIAPQTEGINLLLSHRPEHFSLYAECGYDLVFCGHAHGGQIRLPFIGGLFSPGQGFLPEYIQGVHTSEKTNMVVSRGLGNSSFPLRVLNRPEMIICNLGEKI